MVTEHFKNTRDHAALTGIERFEPATDEEDNTVAAVWFWMNYAWSAFCLQWVAISWAAVVGKEDSP